MDVLVDGGRGLQAGDLQLIGDSNRRITGKGPQGPFSHLGDDVEYSL